MAQPKHLHTSTGDRSISNANISQIYDYQHLPVLSLEEAVEKLMPLVRNLADYVVQAKRCCNRNATFLNWNESAAIYLYTMPTPFSSLLNEALRSENHDTLKPWFSFLKLLTHALEKLPSIETSTVWRGVSKDIALSFADHDVYTWWSVNSCSSNLKVAGLYLAESERNTLFLIKSLNGKDISSYSSIKMEDEVVLLPGTRLHVQSNAPIFGDRLSIVYLEELPRSAQETPA